MRYRIRSIAVLLATVAVAAACSDDDLTGPDNGGEPGAATITTDITASRTLHADTTYTLSGFIHVKAPATLTIEAGTEIRGDYNVVGSSLFIERGARILAIGRADAPIVFTSSRPAGQRQPGDWGGLILIGNARVNRGSPVILEGTGTGATNPQLNYAGGTDDADDSGELRYVRVEFAGYATAPDAELNAFTFAAVGSGTRLSYLQALGGLDDHYEWFGGTADAKYLVSYESGDDHFDASEGFRGRVQYMIAYQSKVLVPRPDAGNVSSDPQGIENDGCAGANCLEGQDSQPFNQPLFANFMLIGTGPGVVDATSGGIGAVLRRGTAGWYVNGAIARWPRAALSLRDEASTGARLADGELVVRNLVMAANGTGFEAGSGRITVEAAANALVTSNAAAGSLFQALPVDANAAADFDWTPAAGSPLIGAGLTTFTGSLAARAGSFVTGTSYAGAADPNGADWWAGWTIYADN